MRRKFYEGYRQGKWTILRLEDNNKKALLRCDCGYEGWKFLSNLSSHNSQGCRECMFKSPQHKTFLSVLRTASRRSIPWDISEDEWASLATKSCFYCDSEPQNIISGYGFRYNGLDRIDSSKGYSLTNVVTSCRICNRAKSDMPQKDFYDWAKRIYVKILSE